MQKGGGGGGLEVGHSSQGHNYIINVRAQREKVSPMTGYQCQVAHVTLFMD